MDIKSLLPYPPWQGLPVPRSWGNNPLPVEWFALRQELDRRFGIPGGLSRASSKYIEGISEAFGIEYKPKE